VIIPTCYVIIVGNKGIALMGARTREMLTWWHRVFKHRVVSHVSIVDDLGICQESVGVCHRMLTCA
jgi:hypothetical protein